MATESVSEKLIRVLKRLSYPVSRIYYKGEADTYFTFRMLQALPSDYGDDDYERLLYSFAIYLTTKKDYTTLLSDVIKLLRSEGYTISSIEAETLDIDTGFFYVPITIKTLEE